MAKGSDTIYILLSIKTRIETIDAPLNEENLGFISYYPLKQGLKPQNCTNPDNTGFAFISYYPLKQGLKLNHCHDIEFKTPLFISYYPLKQGLKRQCNH